jgi:phage tail sheath protein FI
MIVNIFRNMATTQSIKSPGVQINEVDNTLVVPNVGETNVLITGFASKGTTNTIIDLQSMSEFENSFGKPTNSAENYLYFTASQILNTSPANLKVIRLPYGSEAGSGFSNYHSALVYPVYNFVPNATTNVYGISSLTLVSQGSGYTIPPSVRLVGGGLNGEDAEQLPNFQAVLGDPNNPTYAGKVTSVNLSGSSFFPISSLSFGYGFYTAPTIQFLGGDSNVVLSPAASALQNNFVLLNTLIGEPIIGLSSIYFSPSSARGENYLTPPNVIITGGGLSGFNPENPATAIANLADPFGDPTLVGSITSITITNPGYGYVSDPVISFSGGRPIDGTVSPSISSTNFALASASTGIVGYVSDDYALSDNYVIGEPTLIGLNDAEYNKVLTGQVPWLSSYNIADPSIKKFNDLGKGGIIVLNRTKVAIDSTYEGYYLAMVDNSNVDPSLDYTSITGVKTVNKLPTGISPAFTGTKYVNIPQSRLSFNLQSSVQSPASNSLSQRLEQLPTGNTFGSSDYNDSIIFALLRLSTTSYNENTIKLSYQLVETYSGSLYGQRTQQNPNAGAPVSYYLEDVVNFKSPYVKLYVNPYISKRGKWFNEAGDLIKSVRVKDDAKNLYPNGLFANAALDSKDLGNVPLKLQNVLTQLQNIDEVDIDVFAEAGLGTIWSTAANTTNRLQSAYIFDDKSNLNIGDYPNPTNNTGTGLYAIRNPEKYYNAGARVGYRQIVDQLVSFTNNKKDHVLIIDPLRQIFVKGANTLTSDINGFIFSQHINTPLNNLFAGIKSSYVTTYANWLNVNSLNPKVPIWMPPSGFVAALIASAAQTGYPWDAVAGFTRGTLNSNINRLAINPSQKQRDTLYSSKFNPISYFSGEGNVVWGQHMFFEDNSAFSRLNVRRLFLTLEKQTKSILKYFVFEPNTFTTRQRVVNTLSPIFDNAKTNNGLYDYQIVCDGRNNTPDVIDSNQLRVAIYIQPTRTAEFILCDFIAEPTGVNLAQIIGS